MEITLKAAAKINLMLDILDRFEDGYHSLWMLMQSVSLYDKIKVSTTLNQGISITCSNAFIPCDERNTAYKAAGLFIKKHSINEGIKIAIEKGIPHEAGLAGGSADAAAVLIALDTMFKTKMSAKELSDMGNSVGADVPFCLSGGTMLAMHTGVVLAPLPKLPNCFIVIAKPEKGISTVEAYAGYDEGFLYKRPQKTKMLKAVLDGDISKIAELMGNVFEQVVEVPERVAIKAVMRANGSLGECMSGSGPSVFGIFSDEDAAKNCTKDLEKIVSSVFICKPETKGIVI